jgi:hypothetical protein
MGRAMTRYTELAKWWAVRIFEWELQAAKRSVNEYTHRAVSLYTLYPCVTIVAWQREWVIMAILVTHRF